MIMRKKDVNGIVHDLLHYLVWRNPLKNILLHEKIDWFWYRIKYLKEDINEFKEAKIIISGAKEKVKIIYKDSEFTGELSFGE